LWFFGSLQALLATGGATIDSLLEVMEHFGFVPATFWWVIYFQYLLVKICLDVWDTVLLFCY
jgi:hypothetical protein